MSRYESEVWKELVDIQNNHFSNIDILTITGFMTDSQLVEHLNRYKAKLIKK